MNKLFLAMMAAMLAPTAFAYDAQIQFDGKIINSTCTINGNAPGVANTIRVTLPDAEAANFTTVGSTQMNTNFTISLTNCTRTTTTVTWDNMSNVDSATGALKNNGSSNVQVRVLKDASTPVNMASDSGRSITGTSGDLVYIAQYYAKVVPVTVGSVTTYGTITLSYN